MHTAVFGEFERVCRERGAGGDTLEIGAVPSRDSLLFLPALAGARSRVGLDLDGDHTVGGISILCGDANQMPFADDSFDTILCNSMLEHDRFFWRTLAEMRRVARPGALVVLGVPAFVTASAPRVLHVLRRLAGLPFIGPRLESALASTPTLNVHNHPGDFYRFSPQAMREVLLADLEDVRVRQLLDPPRLVGAGIVRKARTQDHS